jgi:UMF1 family MFS transporter
VGIPCSFAFGALADRVGAKRAVMGALGVYCCVALLGYFMSSSWHFFALAGLVALVQGGAQALSRSLFASLVPRQKSAEFFGFFAVGEKFAGVLGPTLFAAIALTTDSSRSAMLWVLSFFLIGGALLSGVDIEGGRAVAREAEERLASE